MEAMVAKLQDALKTEMNTKKQYYDKVNEYKGIVKSLEAQLKEKNEEVARLHQVAPATQEVVSVDKGALEELEAKNAELTKKLEAATNSLAEQKKKNELQTKQLSLYVEELRRNCGQNIDMKNRLEEVIKEKEQLLQANETYKLTNETLKKEQEDYSEQVKKNFARETEYKKSIQELESRIVKPDSLAYVYNMKNETVFGVEDIQVNSAADDTEETEGRFRARFRNAQEGEVHRHVRAHPQHREGHEGRAEAEDRAGPRFQ